jgi:hypothetical protein
VAAQGAFGGQAASFTASVSGTASQTQLANRLAEVQIPLAVSGQRLSSPDITTIGQPLDEAARQ